MKIECKVLNRLSSIHQMAVPITNTNKEINVCKGELYAPSKITENDTNENIMGMAIQTLKGRDV